MIQGCFEDVGAGVRENTHDISADENDMNPPDSE